MCRFKVYNFLLIGLSFVCVHYVAVGDDEYEGLYTLTVEHSFDSGLNPVFSKRGTVTIRSLKSGLAEFIEESPLTDEQKSRLKELASANGIYRIRVGKSSESEDESEFVYSFLKACALYESRLSDLLTVHIDQSGGLIAVSVTTAIPYCTGVIVAKHELSHFNTSVDVQQTVIGPAPETQAYIQKLEQEKIEKAKGQQADNRSFFAKYWMYIVPVLIFVMLSQSMDPNAGQAAARS